MVHQTPRQQRLYRLKMATRVVLADIVNATFGIVSMRRYFKMARQFFAIDDTNMLVRYWASISSSYRDIEVLGNASISTICVVQAKSYDTYAATTYRQ